MKTTETTMEQPITAIEMAKQIDMSKAHAALLVSLLTQDRKAPSRERARLRSDLMRALLTAYGLEHPEEILEGAQRVPMVALLGDRIAVTMNRTIMSSAKTFIEEAIEMKNPQTNEALLSGLQQDRLLELLETIEAARGARGKE